MRVTVIPEGAILIKGRVKRKNATLLHLLTPPFEECEARRFEKACNSGAKPTGNQLHLSWGETDFLEQFFRPDTDSAAGLRVLNGATIVKVMNNRSPIDLGDFGPILYQRAERRLRAQGKLSKPLAGGFAALESLFATAVAYELPLYLPTWQETHRPFSEFDIVFLRVTTRDWTAIKLPARAADTDATTTVPAARTHHQFLLDERGQPVQVQLGLPLEEGDLLERLNRRVRQLGDVCSEPLTHASRAPREELPPAKPMTARAKKAARKRAEKIGYYIDFTRRLRPIPQLHPATIEGLAVAEGVLNPKKHLTKEDYLRLARTAFEHRCKNGIGGRLIVPESAEFYIRLFRAMQLTEEEVRALTAEQLSKLTALAASLTKLDPPAEDDLTAAY